MYLQGAWIATEIGNFLDVEETFVMFFISVTFLRFLTFFNSKRFYFKKRWQSSERQAD